MRSEQRQGEILEICREYDVRFGESAHELTLEPDPDSPKNLSPRARLIGITPWIRLCECDVLCVQNIPYLN